jgi:hypothetical protein
MLRDLRRSMATHMKRIGIATRSKVMRSGRNRSAVSGHATRLSLGIPTAASPKSLRIGEDLRELGIYLASITFKTMP